MKHSRSIQRDGLIAAGVLLLVTMFLLAGVAWAGGGGPYLLPGIIGGGANMDQEGYAPLAVVGLVPVKASAENGPIAPGDLLTTSSTPGHAMKADADPPAGTIIGKALEPLAEGTGVIQMLVMLQ